MKNVLKKALILMATLSMLAALTIPAFAAKFDFEKAIDDFSETTMNTKTLKIGETHRPTAAKVWAEDGNCYSSDEDVVTVAEDGTVTAEGEGTAYVAIVSSTGMYELYCYKVNSVAQEAESSGLFGGMSKIEELAEEEEEEMRERSRDNDGFKWIYLWIAFVLALVGYVVVTTLTLSATSTGKKILPPRQVTANTVRGTAGQRMRYVIPIRGMMRAKKFEKLVNEWLAENPYVTDCTLKMETTQLLFDPFVQIKFFVRKAEIEFTVAEEAQRAQYGFAFLYKFRFFGPIGYSEKKHVAAFTANNPDCQVVSSRGGRIQHFGSNGFFAEYYNYLFFKKN